MWTLFGFPSLFFPSTTGKDGERFEKVFPFLFANSGVPRAWLLCVLLPCHSKYNCRTCTDQHSHTCSSAWAHNQMPVRLCAGKFSLVPLNMAIYIFHKFYRLLLVSCNVVACANAMDVYLLYSLSFQHRHHLRFTMPTDLLALQFHFVGFFFLCCCCCCLSNCMRLFYQQHTSEFRLC